MRLARSVIAFTVLAMTGIVRAQGAHPEIPRWCGKAYEAGSPSFDPLGQAVAPTASPNPLLFLRLTPRHSIYVATEATGELIIDAGLSSFHGVPYTPSYDGDQEMTFTLSLSARNASKTLGKGTLTMNTTENLFAFDLASLGVPQMDPYVVILSGTTVDGTQTFTANASVYYLPAKDSGSATKIDNLYGSLLFNGSHTNGSFIPIVPYGFYGDYGDYFALSNDNIITYFDQGFNVINLVTSFLDDGPLVNTTELMDEIGLYFIYDMRGTYKNLTAVTEQVVLVKDYSSFLMYYTADEPDGDQDPLNATTLAYNLLASLDKYHPVSLVLNCQNFYYDEYSAGADIVLQDTYPIGINATYSIPYLTNCNLTHGDCGCDNCVGSLLDVADRLDDLATYQEWEGGYAKPLWSVLQAFDGEGYWQRLPTAQETWVMALLSFNHGAKGITSWIYPGTDEVNAAHSALALALTSDEIAPFFTNSKARPIIRQGAGGLDVAVYAQGFQAMAVIVSDSYTGTDGNVTVELGFGTFGIVGVPWGNVTWELDRERGILTSVGMEALATSIVILDL